jgi:hypothetical protein
MRSIFVGIIVLSALTAIVHTAQAQTHTPGPPGYGHMQARIGHPGPTQNSLQPSQDIGVQVQSEEEDLSKRIQRDNVRLDREIRNICLSC